MINYKKILNEDIYKYTLDDFLTIPFIEKENNTNFFNWLVYYEKNDIVKHCFENNKYKKLIEKENLLNSYCINISLEKGNKEIIDYWLMNKYITKNDIFNNIEGFLMGFNDLNYLPHLTKENAVLLGNKSIYHVKKDSLEYAIKKGFEPKDVELANFLFCVKNHVDLKEKQIILKIIENKFDIDILLSKNLNLLLEEKEFFNMNNQCMREIIDMTFMKMDLKELCQNHLSVVLKTVEVERNLNSFYFKNKILLENADDFSQESLQKIKKFNKDFYREIEKIRLYQNLINNENPIISKSSVKTKKI